MDPGWIVKGQETKEVEPRSPRLPNGWLSCQSRQSSLDVILAQDNNGGDPDLLSMGEVKPRHQIKSMEDEIRKVQGEVNPRSMEEVTR